jgi:alcohol dehydrogenase (cytochrome c)
MGVFKESMVFMQGTPFWGGGPTTPEAEDGSSYGILAAIEPVSGLVKWKHRSEYPFIGGALATGGGLVFSGDQEGHAFALDDLTGEVLWKFQTGSSIRSQPITWKADGQQFVAIPSGSGGLVPGLTGAPELITNGSAVVVFAVPKSKWFWE